MSLPTTVAVCFSTTAPLCPSINTVTVFLSKTNTVCLSLHNGHCLSLHQQSLSACTYLYNWHRPPVSQLSVCLSGTITVCLSLFKFQSELSVSVCLSSTFNCLPVSPELSQPVCISSTFNQNYLCLSASLQLSTVCLYLQKYPYLSVTLQRHILYVCLLVRTFYLKVMLKENQYMWCLCFTAFWVICPTFSKNRQHNKKIETRVMRIVFTVCLDFWYLR